MVDSLIKVRLFLCIPMVVGIFLSCSQDSNLNPAETKKVHMKIEDTQGNLEYSIVRTDSVYNWLQRIFVHIDQEIISDSNAFQFIVCDIQKAFNLDEGSNISFFTDEKFANYLDEIFLTNEELVGISIEEKRVFRDNYIQNLYVAEFDSNSYLLTLYPQYNLKKKDMKLERCR